jgi:predicted transcriptional regulator
LGDSATEESRAVSEIYRFKVDLVDLLARHFGGQRTLNHLRVGNFIGLCCQCDGRPTSNHEIAQALSLSRATVSRIVSDFVQAGWVTEFPHPEDGRRRLLMIPPDHPRVDEFERALRKRLSKLNEVLQHREGVG